MNLYPTVDQGEFAIETAAGPGSDPFSGYPDVWQRDVCRWKFQMIPPVGSFIDAGPGPDPAKPRPMHKVRVERYEFRPGRDGNMILILITTKV